MTEIKHTERRTAFTLVEVLVTSVLVAIIGIAALIAYSGYIRESQRQATANVADAAATAAHSYLRKTGSTIGLDSTALGLFLTNPGEYTVDIDTSGRTVSITHVKTNITVPRNF